MAFRTAPCQAEAYQLLDAALKLTLAVPLAVIFTHPTMDFWTQQVPTTDSKSGRQTAVTPIAPDPDHSLASARSAAAARSDMPLSLDPFRLAAGRGHCALETVPTCTSVLFCSVNFTSGGAQ
jgi:hypothetical protein